MALLQTVGPSSGLLSLAMSLQKANYLSSGQIISDARESESLSR